MLAVVATGSQPVLGIGSTEKQESVRAVNAVALLSIGACKMTKAELEHALDRAHAAVTAGTKAFAEPTTADEQRAFVDEYQDVLKLSLKRRHSKRK
jgi:hypothetical protein